MMTALSVLLGIDLNLSSDAMDVDPPPPSEPKPSKPVSKPEPAKPAANLTPAQAEVKRMSVVDGLQ